MFPLRVTKTGNLVHIFRLNSLCTAFVYTLRYIIYLHRVSASLCTTVKVHSLHPLSCWEVHPMQHALH